MSNGQFDDNQGAMQRIHVPPAMPSLFQQLQYLHAAKTEKAMLDANTDVVSARQRLVEQQTSYALSEINGRSKVTRAVMEEEDARRELDFERHLRSLPHAEQRTLLSAENETERRLAIRSAYRTMRFTGTASRLLDQPATRSGERPQVEVDVSGEEIKRHALEGVLTISNAAAAERSQQYKSWEQDLKKRLPEFAVEEITSQARSLLKVLSIAV